MTSFLGDFYDPEDGYGTFPDDPEAQLAFVFSPEHLGDVLEATPPSWVMDNPEHLKVFGLDGEDSDEMKAKFDEAIKLRIPEVVRKFRDDAEEYWKSEGPEGGEEEKEGREGALEEARNYWGESWTEDKAKRPECENCEHKGMYRWGDYVCSTLKEYPFPEHEEEEVETSRIEAELDAWRIDSEDEDFKRIEEEKKKRAERRRRNAEMSGSGQKAEQAKNKSDESSDDDNDNEEEEIMNFVVPAVEMEEKKSTEGGRKLAEPSAWLKAQMAHRFSGPETQAPARAKTADSGIPELEEEIPDWVKEEMLDENIDIESMVRDKLPMPEGSLPSIADVFTYYPAEAGKSEPVPGTSSSSPPLDLGLKGNELLRAQKSAGPKPEVALTPEEILSLLPHVEIDGDKVILSRDSGVEGMPRFESRLRDVFGSALVLREDKKKKNENPKSSKDRGGAEAEQKKKYGERDHRNKAKYLSQKRGRGKKYGGFDNG